MTPKNRIIYKERSYKITRKSINPNEWFRKGDRITTLWNGRWCHAVVGLGSFIAFLLAMTKGKDFLTFDFQPSSIFATYTHICILAYSHICLYAIALFILCLLSSLRAQVNFINYTASDGLANNRIYAIAIDADNIKWFATLDGGVSSFDGTTWKSFKAEILTGTTHIYTTRKDRLAHDEVCSAAVDADNVKWFGTHVGGVSSFGGSTWKTYTTEDGLATNNYVHAIAVDADNVKWFGTYGVSSFDGTIWKTYATEDWLAYSIFAIAVGSDNVKWFGTYGGGVSSFDGNTWKTYTEKDGLADNYVLAITADADNVKWFGTPSGVSSFDGSTWKTYTAEDGLADNKVYSIAVDADNVIWFGTIGGGVSMYEVKRDVR